MTSKLPELEDDGLNTPEVGDWAEEKYRLVGFYAELFAKSMKGKWGSRVYLDLFSGAGRARIKSTNKIVPASPLLALGVTDKFDRYIFCEIDPDKLSALETRVKREYPSVDAHYIPGDTNKNVDEIMTRIPQHYPDFKVLCFCFVDPFRMEHLDFETIRRLSTRLMDFMVLIPSGMDANRNVAKYTKEENKKVGRFLGNDKWRDEWAATELKGENFERFVRDQFGKQMEKLGYIYSGPEDMRPVRLPEKNVLLYRLAFFSRSDLGKKFWEQARKYSDDQRSLF
jgi:three-Cys-motif partner protein